MRTAVFSDIHGNCVGLDAVIDDITRHPVDQMVCLGDAAQGGPQPAEVIARLGELGCSVVMGNSDAFLLGETSEEPVSDRTLEVRAWSLSQLDSEQIEFMRSFQPTVELPLGDGKTLLGFHGSPRSFDEVILPETPEEDFAQMLEGHSASMMAGGHTHLQWLRRLGNSFYFNPGSAGLAYDRNADPETYRFDPWAEYAVVTSEEGRVGLEFRRVPFEVDELMRAYSKSGIPHGTASAERHRPLE